MNNNKDITAGSVLSQLWAGFISGNLGAMAICGFLGTCFLLAGVAFYDGLNGRGCNGPEYNDPFSWGKSLGCGSRGIMETAPRAKTQPKPRID